MRRLGATLGLVVVVSALGGCRGEVRGPPGPGDEAPDVVGLTLAGDSLALADLRGRPVLVNLWATWCAPCRRETPYLQSLFERYGPRGLRVVGISEDDASAGARVRDFAADAGVTYDILLDPRARAMDRYQVIGLPATFLLDGDGVIRLARIGQVQESDSTFVLALDALVGG